MLNVYELNIFAHAAETQNFSEAARRLHLTQPAISLTIKSLEKQLGVDLFHNVGRNVILTDAGRSLLPMARDLVALSNQIEESVCALRGQVVGQLTIGCGASAGKYLLPSIIGRFRKLYPQVKVSVCAVDTKSVVAKLMDRQIQIGITCVAEKNADLEYQEMLEDELVLIVHPAHPWAARGTVQLRDLSGEELILHQEGVGNRQILLDTLAKQGIHLEDLTVAMELGSCEEVELAVESGMGVAFVSRLAAVRPLAAGRIATVAVPETSFHHPLFLARNRKQACSCAQLKFCDMVRSPETTALLASMLGT